MPHMVGIEWKMVGPIEGIGAKHSSHSVLEMVLATFGDTRRDLTTYQTM